MEETSDNTVSMPQQSRGFRKFWIFFALIFPLFFVFMFGFFAKTLDEYDCAFQITQKNRELVNILGEPIKPGFFASSSYYTKDGSVIDTLFSTGISGPFGNGKIQVQVYRTPIDSSMIIQYEGDGGEFPIYNGPYECP